MLITDQFAFTHPEALRKALACGIRVRNYVGSRVYHPKVYIGYKTGGRPLGAIVGSANISDSGLVTGIEAGAMLANSVFLRQLNNWFSRLFRDNENTQKINERRLKALERLWEAAVIKRIEALRETREKAKISRPRKAIVPEDANILEDLLSGVRLPIGVLSIDQGGNNIRNLQRLLAVLSRYPRINSKERSELRLLGLMNGSVLTSLGERAKVAPTEEALARIWCEWVRGENEARLLAVNPRIANFRRAANEFWRLRREVRSFFLRNLQVYRYRPILQAIELFCNIKPMGRKLILRDFQSFAAALLNPDQVPRSVQESVADYLANKGRRSWGNEDRRIMLLAWRRGTRRQ